jgi:hypothetical protein
MSRIATEPSHWREQRAGLRSALAALDRDKTARAFELLGQVEWEAFQQRENVLAGECGFARYCLAGGDTRGAAGVVRRLLQTRYRDGEG